MKRDDLAFFRCRKQIRGKRCAQPCRGCAATLFSTPTDGGLVLLLRPFPDCDICFNDGLAEPMKGTGRGIVINITVIIN